MVNSPRGKENLMSGGFVCVCDYISVVLVGRDLFASEHFSFECLFPAAVTWSRCVSCKIRTLGSDSVVIGKASTDFFSLPLTT